MPLRHSQACDLVLYEMYWFAAQPDSVEDVEPEIIYDIFRDRTSEQFVSSAIEKLCDDELLERIGVLPDSYGITSRGLAYVDRQLDDVDSFLFLEHAERPSASESRIPAAGRFVELDHNSTQYQDAVNAGEALINAVRNNNRYGDTDPDGRDQRLAELEAGYRLLDTLRINPSTVKAVLTGVLAYLAMKFADEPIGELAKSAWSTLKVLLGIQ